MGFTGILKAEHYDDFFKSYFSTNMKVTFKIVHITILCVLTLIFGSLAWSILNDIFYRIVADVPLMTKVITVVPSVLLLIATVFILSSIFRNGNLCGEATKQDMHQFPRDMLKLDRLLGEVEYKICDNELSIAKTGDVSQYKWGIFEKCVETEKSFLLYFDAGICEIFPKNVFKTPTEMNEFRSVLEAKIGAIQ